MTITELQKEGFSYAEAIKQSREKISLEEIGITETKIRRSANGGLLIEIPGEEAQKKANTLANQLRQVMQDAATVASPIKRGEIRMFGLVESVTAEEVASVVASLCECTPEEVSVGPIRAMRSGLGMAWAKLPLGAAIKATTEGRIRIGWTIARIELLKARPLQCHKCWQYGHVKFACKSSENFLGACYNCEEHGHQVRMCSAQPRCAICQGSSRAYQHRLGGPACQSRIEFEKGVARGPIAEPVAEAPAPAPVQE